MAITREMVQVMLARHLPDVMFGAVIAMSGLITLLLYRLRRDRALLWFGIFAGLYGLRLLLASEPVQIATGLSEFRALYIVAAITYVICLPVALLLAEIFPAWRPVLRIVAWGVSGFALTGIVSDAWQQKHFSLNQANSVMVLCGLAALLIALFRLRSRAAEAQASRLGLIGLRIGLMLFSAAVVFENGTILLSGWRDTLNLEPFGLFAFLIALGYIIAQRVMLDHERLLALDKELQIARRIQTSILPRQMPAGRHWQMAALYLPMTSVAGDFYDFLLIDEQRIGILMADVSGHGVPAALIASMVKIAIAAQAPYAAHPAQVLAGMNGTLSGNLQGQYVTAAYLYLDLAERKARYAAAAHPPLLRHSADGAVEAIEENGLMLGVFPQAVYTERELELLPGDRFLLYTDGFLEATNEAGEFFGDARARAALSDSIKMPVEAMLDSLRASVERWSPAAQDDLTLLAIRV